MRISASQPLIYNVALIAGVAALVCSVQPVYGQSIAEAVKWGLETSPTLEAERLRLKGLTELQVQARNLRRPTIQFDATTSLSERAVRRSGTYEWNRTEPGSVSISANQPLMLGGRYEAAQRQADLRVGQAIARLQSQEFTTVRQIVEVYASVRRDYEVVAIREEGVRTQLKQLEGTKVRQAARLLGITEVSQVESRIAITQRQLSSANAQLVASWARLERLIGRKPSGLTDDRLMVTDQPISVSEAIDLALSLNHELKVARYSHDIARASASGIQAETAPRTSLQAGLTAASDGGFNGARTVEAQIGARFSVPLWSAGQPQSRLRAVLLEANAARVEASNLERVLTEQVTAGMAALNAARQNVDLAAEQVRAAGAARIGIELELGVGLRSTIEVLNQEQEWQEARVTFEAARAEYVITQVGLATLIGIDPSGVISSQSNLTSEGMASLTQSRRTIGLARWERPLIGVFDALTTVDAESRSLAAISVRRVLGPEP